MTKEKKYAAKPLEKRFSGGKKDGTHCKRIAQKAAFVGQKAGEKPGSIRQPARKRFYPPQGVGF
ncbi:hypothetical protein [Neglectibacter caecimuris]|uniref:hypothetical protein n=1 Tax=Neglectibacter caecimuris TaxID=3093658 RepID=UPI002AC8BDFC|nr:hypothetical protein [Neglectibacter sp. M00184]